MNKGIWIETLKLNDLTLWDENARFSDKYFNKDEKELIAHFCNRKDFKIEELTKEVVRDFDLPQLEKLVIYNNEGRNMVLEGNRRITVYKLLNNPELSPNATIKYFFLKKKKEVSVKNNFLFECIVTDNITEGFRYIERKHLRGNNEVGWKDQERTNHNVRRGTATQKEEFKVAVSKIIKGLDFPEELKENILGPRFVTNFWRIVGSNIAWSKYGFSLSKDGVLQVKDKIFKEHLKVIIWNVLQKKDFSGNKIDSRTLNTNIEKEEYLNSISDKDVERVSVGVKEHTKETLFGSSAVQIQEASKNINKTPITTGSSILFGRKLILKSGPVNNLYRAIDLIYEQNKTNEQNLNVVFPVLGMSLRLILDVAAKEYYKHAEPNKTGQWFEDFLKIVKNEFKKQNTIEKINYLSLTTDWLSSKYNIEGILHTWSHGDLPANKSEVLKMSKIIGDILVIYFNRK